MNKSNRELFTLAVDGGTPVQITKTAGGEYNAIWSGDGNKIFFLAAAENGLQIWSMNPDGTGKMQISNEAESITNIELAPSGERILFTCDIKIDQTLDLKGVPCPMNFVKTKLKLEGMENGEVLEIFLDDGDPIKNVTASVKEDGHKILKVEEINEHWKLIVKKLR